MAIRIDEPARRLEIGVGDLVTDAETDPFAATGASVARLQAGVRAHGDYARHERQEDRGYGAEVMVRGEVEVEGFTAAVSGRVDGLRRDGERLVVEEVKTVILGASAFAALTAASYPVYRRQLEVYLFLLSRSRGEREPAVPVALAGRLVFVNLPGGAIRQLEVGFDPDEVGRWVVARIGQVLADWRQERQRLAGRRALAERLVFPFPSRRPHQGEMERAARLAFDEGRALLVAAPPGLGKTAAALSAALGHALASDRRVFFATSRTTEQRLVARTLGRLVGDHPGLTAVVLRAKAKICTNDVVFCRAEVCEFARDWLPKVRASRSRERLLARGLVEPDEVRAEGLGSLACPFELELDLAERADVVVGDYNYVFDPQVALRRDLAEGAADDLVLVIDEAHNLLERAREYYSPSLDSARVEALLEQVRALPGAVYRALEEWLSELLARLARLGEETEDLEVYHHRDGRPAWVVPAERSLVELGGEIEAILLHYLVQRRESGALLPEDPILDLAYGFLRFIRVLELDGDEFVHLLEPGAGGRPCYRILCLDPSRQLGRRLATFHAVLAMSATLSPEAYYRDLLGFPRQRTTWLGFPSPFRRENRRVLVVPTVSTTYRERARWYDRVAETIEEVAAARPGHWLAYFPSHAYLREVDARLGRPVGERIVQAERMDEREREEVLARLESPDGRPRLLLGVLGGIFAEGVDLPGEAVVGVIVVSPGLPQVSLERELLRGRLEERFGSGFDYAYLVPGMSRVVQAAGRLVRGESDRGVIVLLDRRFALPSYNRYFPRDWYQDSPAELVVEDPAAAVASFFAAGGPAGGGNVAP